MILCFKNLAVSENKKMPICINISSSFFLNFDLFFEILEI